MSDEQTAYVANGQAVRVIRDIRPGCVVVAELWKDDCTGDEFEGTPLIVDRVFAAAPIAKMSEEYVELQEKVAALWSERNQLHIEMQEIRGKYDERLTLLKRHKGLQLLEDFIEGRITHYVMIPGYRAPSIVKFSDAKSEMCSWHGDGTRLLSLLGNSDGDLEWRLNEYKDGSGCWTTVIPCISEEAAKKCLSEWIEEEIKKEKPDERVVECADKYSLSIPDDYRNAVREKKRQQAVETVEKLEARVAEAKAKVAACDS